jgi:hypothetical protein
LVVKYIEKSTPSAQAIAIFFGHCHNMLMVMSAYLVTSTTIVHDVLLSIRVMLL